MRDRFIIMSFLLLVGAAMLTVAFPDGAASALIVIVFSGLAILIFRRFSEEREFLTTIFLAALLLRLVAGVMIHVYDMRDFFGPDALTYDFGGWQLVQYWRGEILEEDLTFTLERLTSGIGWGMNYLVAAVYYFFGRNMLAAQSLCGVIGAATSPMVYYCSVKMFANKKVGKIAAVFVAFFPAFIIWSCQLMKDGVLIFLLVAAMTMVVHLQEKLSYGAIAILLLSLLGIISLRFYIFYMVVVAIIGSFLVGSNTSLRSAARRIGALMALGVALTYFGTFKDSGTDLQYADLERIQVSRSDLAQSGQSGFGEELDVSTTQGALTALPIGFTYLMFAPFPWELLNFRQSIALPETIIWWASMPLLVAGLLFSVRHRLRRAAPALLFSLMLTLGYSLFQGNVGTAYRQRTQIQVFLFIFIAVGAVVYQEYRQNAQLVRENQRRRLDDALRARTAAR